MNAVNPPVSSCNHCKLPGIIQDADEARAEYYSGEGLNGGARRARGEVDNATRFRPGAESATDRAGDRAAGEARAVDGDEGDVEDADAVDEPDEVAPSDGGEETERDVS